MINLFATLEALKNLRGELHNVVEQGVIDRFDSVIHELESYEYQEPDKIDSDFILRLIGAVLEVIPSIAAAIDWLKNMSN